MARNKKDNMLPVFISILLLLIFTFAVIYFNFPVGYAFLVFVMMFVWVIDYTFKLFIFSKRK